VLVSLPMATKLKEERDDQASQVLVQVQSLPLQKQPAQWPAVSYCSRSA
jgi:hypothetical protein